MPESEDLKNEYDLARQIVTSPAAYPWIVLRKFQVLEYYLSTDGGTAWGDNREVVMLAGIKADLLRYEMKEREA